MTTYSEWLDHYEKRCGKVVIERSDDLVNFGARRRRLPEILRRLADYLER